MQKLFIFIFLLVSAPSFGQSAKEIVKKVQSNALGESSSAKMRMQIIRKDWTKEMRIKTWSQGEDQALILITAPARDKGSAYLKREKEIWNWQPSINRVVRMPPSMMMMSWMGSDFSNDDLVRQSSLVEDYSHSIIGGETISGQECYVVALRPLPDAPVVWGKIEMWIEKNHFYQVQSKFFDEDNYLIHTILGDQVKEMKGHKIPTRLTVISEESPEEKTVVEYETLDFDVQLSSDFFSVRNMKSLRPDDY